MIQELVFTSAPHGLKPGTSGFCTVASTSGMASNLARLLESLSGYRHIFPATSVDADKNPVAISHLIATVGGKSFSIVSRIAHAGLDYSNRSNKIAHHLVLPHPVRLSGGPAVLLENDDLFFRTWDESPRILPPRSIEGRPVPPAPCTNWKEVTGHAGWGGAPIQAWMEQKPVYLVIRPETPVRALLLESLNLLPDPIRWNVAFSSSLTPLPPGIKCHWRCVLAGSPEERDVRRNPSNLLVDLTRPLPPPTNRYVQEAEQGRQVTSTMPPPPKPGAALADTSSGDALRGSELFEDDSWTESLPLATTLSDEPLRRSGSSESISLAPPSISPGKRRAASHKEPQRFVDPSVPLTNRSRSRRSPARWLPFTVIALLLVITGVLIGILLTRPSEQPVAQNENLQSTPADSNSHTASESPEREAQQPTTQDEEKQGEASEENGDDGGEDGQTNEGQQPGEPDGGRSGGDDGNATPDPPPPLPPGDKTDRTGPPGDEDEHPTPNAPSDSDSLFYKIADLRTVNEDDIISLLTGVPENVELELAGPPSPIKELEISRQEKESLWDISEVTELSKPKIAKLFITKNELSLEVRNKPAVTKYLSKWNLLVKEQDRYVALFIFQPLETSDTEFTKIDLKFNSEQALVNRARDQLTNQDAFVVKHTIKPSSSFTTITKLVEGDRLELDIELAQGQPWSVHVELEVKLDLNKKAVRFGSLHYQLVFDTSNTRFSTVKGDSRKRGNKHTLDQPGIEIQAACQQIINAIKEEAPELIETWAKEKYQSASEKEKNDLADSREDFIKEMKSQYWDNTKGQLSNFSSTFTNKLRMRLKPELYLVTNYPEIFDHNKRPLKEKRGALFIHGFVIVIGQSDQGQTTQNFETVFDTVLKDKNLRSGSTSKKSEQSKTRFE